MKNIFLDILFIFVGTVYLQAQTDSLLGSKLIEHLFAHRFAQTEIFFDESVKTKINKKIFL